MLSFDMNLIKECEKLLAKNKICAVSSVTEDGYPRICIMVALKTESIKNFYFSCSASSVKVENYKNNAKAGVTFWYGGDSVTLTGEMTVVNNKTLKDSLWRESLSRHFINGGKDDPEYCIIKFTSREAKVLFGGHYETIKIK